jgi:hypothetical protein
MNFLWILLEFSSGWLLPGWLSKEDLSIVGKSPLEQRLQGFWRTVWYLLGLLAVVLALWFWLGAPRFNKLRETQHHSTQDKSDSVTPLMK